MLTTDQFNALMNLLQAAILTYLSLRFPGNGRSGRSGGTGPLCPEVGSMHNNQEGKDQLK